MKCSFGISNFPEEIYSLSHSIVLCFFFIDHWGRLSYLSLLFFGTLHSDGYIFPCPLCRLLLFFPQLFVRSSQTTILLCCNSFFSHCFPLAFLMCTGTQGKEQWFPPPTNPRAWAKPASQCLRVFCGKVGQQCSAMGRGALVENFWEV